MSIRIEGDVVFLDGNCGVEDAEALASALEGGGDVRVDLTPCRHMHSAVVQALLSFGPALEGAPDNDFLTRFVLPALAGPDAPDSEPPSSHVTKDGTPKSMTE
jgi:hypothetical protein